MSVRLNPAKEIRRMARSGGGATSMGGNVMLPDSPPYAIDGPAITGQLPTTRLSTAETDPTQVLAPDGAGGATFRDGTLDGTLAESTGQDIADALTGAALPSAANVYATMDDLSGGALTNPMNAAGELIVGGPAISAPTYYAETLPMFAYSNGARAEDSYAVAGANGGHVHLLNKSGDTVTWAMTGPGTMTFDLWYGTSGRGTLSQDGTVVQTGLLPSGSHPNVSQAVASGTHVYALTSNGTDWLGFDGVTLTPTGTIPGGYPTALPIGADGTVLGPAGGVLGYQTSPKGLPLGLTGAVAATRYVGGTAAVAPTTGTFALGDFVITQTGHIYVCTVAGSPGTWVDVTAAAQAASQPLDSDLTAIAALTTTAYGRAFLTLAGASDLTALTSGTAFPTGAALTAYGDDRPFWRSDLLDSFYHHGSNWLSCALHYVSVGNTPIQAVADASTTTTSISATTCAEMTALPAAGVTAVQVVVIIQQTTADPALPNYVAAINYDASTAVAVPAYGSSVAGFQVRTSGTVSTGGTNNRQLKYVVNVGAGTVTYYVRVYGYWAHVIAT